MASGDNTAITIKMIGLHAGVVVALATAVITLGQFVFWTRAEGQELKAIVLQMKEIIQRVESEQTQRAVIDATIVERQESVAAILKEVSDEVREIRRSQSGNK